MNESATNLRKLQDELLLKKSKWREIQVEWAPSYVREKTLNIPAKEQPTYLQHIMATSFHKHTPIRSKCMFQLSVKQMTTTESPRIMEDLETIIRPISLSLTSVLNGDKFSLEPAGVNPVKNTYTSIPELSRFLLDLSGDPELAMAPDPVRNLERITPCATSTISQNDRLIH